MIANELIVDVMTALLLALIVSFLATPLVRRLAFKIGAVDIPRDNRRMHDHPIPRLGGLAIFLGFLVSVLAYAEIDLQMQGILIGATIIAVLGMADDIHSLPAKFKFVVQILAALCAVFHGVAIEVINNPNIFSENEYWVLGWWSIPISVIWIVAITNAVNLIDGLDGLADGISTIGALTMLILALILGENEIALLCGALVVLFRRSSPALACIWIGIGLAGLYLGLVNGIPLKISGMPNDGYNALHLGKDPVSRRAFWAQLAINAAQMEGRRLRDIPEEWFILPGDAGPDDPMKGAVWVYRYSRLVDQGRYEEASALREQLLQENGKLAAVHQYALQADQGLFDLMDGRISQGLDILGSAEIKAFCRQMKGNPGIVLVQYAAARAAGKTQEADRLLARLEKDLDAWPYPGDADATRELLARVEDRLASAVEKG